MFRAGTCWFPAGADLDRIVHGADTHSAAHVLVMFQVVGVAAAHLLTLRLSHAAAMLPAPSQRDCERKA